MADTIELLDVIKGLPASKSGRALSFDQAGNRLVRDDDIRTDLTKVATDLSNAVSDYTAKIAAAIKGYQDGDTAVLQQLSNAITTINQSILAVQNALGTRIDGVVTDYKAADTALSQALSNAITTLNQSIAAVQTDAGNNLTNAIKTLNGVIDTLRPYINDKNLRLRIAYGIPRLAMTSGWYETSSSYTGYSFVVNQPAKRIEAPAAIRFGVRGLVTNAAITKVRTRVYRRANTNLNAGIPGYAGDTLLSTTVSNLADVLEDQKTSGDLQMITAPIAPGEAFTAAFVYNITVELLNASDVPQIFGMGRGTDSTGAAAGTRGYVKTTGNYAALSSPIQLYFELLEKYGAPSDEDDPPFGEFVSLDDDMPLRFSGLAATIPELTIERGSGSLRLRRTAVAFVAPGTANTSDDTTLTNGVTTAVRYRDLTNVEVRRKSDNALLVNGTDYTVDTVNGTFVGLTMSTATPVFINYQAPQTRYDLLYINPLSGIYSVQLGTERGIDVNEFRPVLPDGSILVFTVFVRQTDVELIPSFQFKRRVRLGNEGKHAVWVEHNRRALRRTFGKMRRGEAITLAGYGSGMTAHGVASAAADVTAPNGVRRDAIGYLSTGRISPDVLSIIPRHDHNDGVYNGHIHTAPNYYLKMAIEEAYGVSCNYLNFGLTNSTSLATSNGALFPNRLNALIAAAPDLCVIEFGTFELGSTALYGNILVLLRNLRFNNIDRIVMGIPLPSEFSSVAKLSAWHHSNEALVRAAEETDSAYIPIHQIAHPANLGAMGMSLKTACAVDVSRLPGPFECEFYGHLLASIIN